MNSGNLVLYGTHNWGAIDVSTTPTLSGEQAQAVVQAHLSGFTIAGWWQEPELVLVPLANGEASAANEGRGLPVPPRLGRSARRSRGASAAGKRLVDAHSGQLLSFADTNQYLDHKKVIGGIFPVSNDGQSPGGVPDGIEQPGYPMSHAYVFDSRRHPARRPTARGWSKSTGSTRRTSPAPSSGSWTTAASSTSPRPAPPSTWASSGGTDCTVPAGHSAGDTHSARTGFYEVNRLIDQAKSWVGPRRHGPAPAG